MKIVEEEHKKSKTIVSLKTEITGIKGSVKTLQLTRYISFLIKQLN
jgi:hypothetical protein